MIVIFQIKMFIKSTDTCKLKYKAKRKTYHHVIILSTTFHHAAGLSSWPTRGGGNIHPSHGTRVHNDPHIP